MSKAILKTKIQRATEQQQKAFGIFTQTVVNLRKSNEGLGVLMDELDEKEVKLRDERELATKMLSENVQVIGNIESMLGTSK